MFISMRARACLVLLGAASVTFSSSTASRAESLSGSAAGTMLASTVGAPQGGSGGRNDGLFDVAFAGVDDAWAVGFQHLDRTEQNLILHWDGSTWRSVASPHPSTANALTGLSVLSADDVWAVGGTGYETMALHWDGTRWQRVHTPNPGGYSSSFDAVVAVSSSDVWAVGEQRQEYEGPAEPLFEHWDGQRWSAVSGPTVPGFATFKDADATTSDDVWAVGSAVLGKNHLLIEHWDGTAWSVVPGARPGKAGNRLGGVTALSPTSAWTVGSRYDADGEGTLIEHWDGTTWQSVPSPDPGTTSRLEAVGASGPDDVWAVGAAMDQRTKGPLIEHWDGQAWTVTAVQPTQADSSLGAVSVLSPAEALAVGTVNAGRQGVLIEHWDGHDWTRQRVGHAARPVIRPGSHELQDEVP